MEYTFTLKYQLADDDRNPDVLVERLAKLVATMPWLASVSRGGWRWSSFARRRAQMRLCVAHWLMCVVPCPRPG